MAFIAKQKVNGNDYYYLRKSVREGKKVKSICLGYLGKNKKEAQEKMEELLKSPKREVKRMEKDKLDRRDISIEELSIFCKRRGFVYPSGDIYGGLAGFWDFGPLGVELKNNIKKEWWNFHVTRREDVVGIDGSIITSPLVWKASGHVDSFSDLFVVCKKCKKPNKIDKDELGKVRCGCGGEYDEKTAKEFGLMFKTNIGEKGESYLRPETAQLIFTNFKLVQENSRKKLPFGIAQMGKSFRNEIAPRDFLFRCREFEQMELQYFIDPSKLDDCPFYEKIKNTKIGIWSSSSQENGGEEEILSLSEMLEKKIFKNKWHVYWLWNSYQWFLNLGVDKNNLRLREHRKDELAHYAQAAVDIEYKFHFGWKEIFGSHDRGQFDLGEHEKFSKKDMKILDEETHEKKLAHVIEASFGFERAFLVFMIDSYFFSKQRNNFILKLHPLLSPIKAAIFPIVKREDFEKFSEKIVDDLNKEWNVVFDRSGSIGRRYSRNDEIGTPFCITIDEESLKNKDVSVRDRDTKQQIRVKVLDMKEVLKKLINKEIDFSSAGKLII